MLLHLLAGMMMLVDAVARLLANQSIYSTLLTVGPRCERKDRIMKPKIRQFGVRDESRSGAHNRNTTMTNNNTSWQQQGIHYQIL